MKLGSDILMTDYMQLAILHSYRWICATWKWTYSFGYLYRLSIYIYSMLSLWKTLKTYCPRCGAKIFIQSNNRHNNDFWMHARLLYRQLIVDSYIGLSEK